VKQVEQPRRRKESRLHHLFNLPLEEQRKPSLIVLIQSSFQFEALVAEVYDLLHHLLIETSPHSKKSFMPLQSQDGLLEFRIRDDPLHW
jgi:hypothetical protein